MSSKNQGAATEYLHAIQAIVERVRNDEIDNIERAADICAESIASGGLVHLFGTGHSRIMVEEMFPRHGSFPGFHPIVELSLTYHNQVVGPNGQRQAMYLERVEGFGEIILNNFVLEPPDSFIVFSNSGVNEVVIDVALGAQRRKLPVIAVTSVDHCMASEPRHSSGKRLPDIADVTVDNGTPAGDALVEIEGLDVPVGPGSTIGGVAVANALKSAVAQRLTDRGKPPNVLTSSVFVGREENRRLFEQTYDDYRRRMLRAYGGRPTFDRADETESAERSSE